MLTRRFALTLGMCSLVIGCSEGENPTSRSSDRPMISSAGPNRFLLETSEDNATGESCVTDEEVVTCTWDDGFGTTCEYSYTEDTLLSQDCDGDWGSYDCTNTGDTINCTLDTEGGSCEDVWSNEFDLVETTCEHDTIIDSMPDESCEEQEDGSTICTWDDGYTSCTFVMNADGTLQSEVCGDGWWSYVCETVDDVVVCEQSEDGEVICTDTWTLTCEPIELGCGYYGDDWDDDWDDDWTPPEEDCVQNEDGTVSCSWDDGAQACTYTFGDDPEFPQEIHCEGGGYTSDCTTEDDGYLHCTTTYPDGTCTEVMDRDRIIESDCPWTNEGDWDDGDWDDGDWDEGDWDY